MGGSSGGGGARWYIQYRKNQSNIIDKGTRETSHLLMWQAWMKPK